MDTFKSWIKNLLNVEFPRLPDKLTLTVKPGDGLFYSYSEVEIMPVQNVYTCEDFTDRFRNATDLLVQRVNSLHGREAAIRACIADLRRQITNCGTGGGSGGTGNCTDNQKTIQMQNLIRLEATVADIETILAQPC